MVMNQLYDRRGLPLNFGWAATNVVPHVRTVRITYTCPAATAAELQSLALLMGCQTGAAGVGITDIRTQLNLNAVGLVQLDQLIMIEDTQYNKLFTNRGVWGIVEAGDVVEVSTFDAKAGGIFNYNAGFSLMEFVGT